MEYETITPIEYQTKIEKVEQEILQLKKSVFAFPKKIVSLKGILKGVQITEGEIEQSKKSLFREIKV